MSGDYQKVEIGNGTFYIGDCFDVMRDLPDGSVDMVLCDLPYGTTACVWDCVLPFERVWESYKRLTKVHAAIVLTASQPFSSALGASNLPWLRYSWIWEKARPTNFLHAKRMPLKGFEEALVFYQKAPIYNPQGTTQCDRVVKNGGTKRRKGGLKANGDVSFTGHMGGPNGFADRYQQKVTGYPRGIVKFSQESNPIHPTQKPVALFEYLIRTYTNEDMVVLDNTAGSGTTAIAAENAGRRWICIERDPEYAAKAIERIRAHVGETAAAPPPVQSDFDYLFG